MKKNYFFFLFALLCVLSYGQGKSSDIESNLSEVSINITSGNDTYNKEDLHYHAQRASIALRKVIESLEASRSCDKALELSNQIIGLLDVALIADNHGDGLINISECKELITKTFYEYDLCSMNGSTSSISTTTNAALTDLEQQQNNLKLQQQQLEQQAKEIKRKLAAQKEKEAHLLKQNFINANKKGLASNIKAYNDQLKACDCNETMFSSSADDLTQLNSKSMAEIKAYYLDKTIAVTQKYITNLNSCKN